MDTPTCDDKVTFDANCLIHYSLDLGFIDYTRVRHINTQGLREFLDIFKTKDVELGYFEFIMKEAYDNIILAVNKMGKDAGVRAYKSLKFANKGEGNLDKLIGKLTKFQSQWTEQEVEDARQFYKNNEVDVRKVCNLTVSKNNIPGDSDLRLLVCAHNLDCGIGYILSDDGHFTAYEDAIHGSKYDVEVLDAKKCISNMLDWGWKS